MSFSVLKLKNITMSRQWVCVPEKCVLAEENSLFLHADERAVKYDYNLLQVIKHEIPQIKFWKPLC